jgi:hypothetical protein
VIVLVLLAACAPKAEYPGRVSFQVQKHDPQNAHGLGTGESFSFPTDLCYFVNATGEKIPTDLTQNSACETDKGFGIRTGTVGYGGDLKLTVPEGPTHFEVVGVIVPSGTPCEALKIENNSDPFHPKKYWVGSTQVADSDLLEFLVADDNIYVGDNVVALIPVTKDSNMGSYSYGRQFLKKERSTGLASCFETPTVAITSPAAGSLINLANMNAITLSGTCSQPGQLVNFSGTIGGNTACQPGNIWSANVDFSATPDGTITVTAGMNLHGNVASQSRTLVKNTAQPTGAAINIDSGAAYTSAVAVNLNLTAGGATEMYVTNDATCATSGTWEAFSSTKSGWTLSTTNASTSVSVKFRNAAGNETACVSDSIIQDSLAPTLASASITNSSPSNSTTFNLVFGWGWWDAAIY